MIQQAKLLEWQREREDADRKWREEQSARQREWRNEDLENGRRWRDEDQKTLRDCHANEIRELRANTRSNWIAAVIGCGAGLAAAGFGYLLANWPWE